MTSMDPELSTAETRRTKRSRWAMPTREGLARNRWLKPIAHRFLSPELWRFTRRSVPRGVSLGLFCGFIVPVGQIFLAAFMALPARANVPLAATTTLITNPFTFPFWVLVANRTGAGVLAIDNQLGTDVIGSQMRSDTWLSFSGFFEAAGVTVFGFVVLAIVSAAVGYLVSSLGWRWWIARKRRVRLKAMARRLDGRLEARGG